MASGSVMIVLATVAAAGLQPVPQIPSAVPPVAVDVVTMPSSVLLGPGEVTVLVDGQPRKVISVRPILRGPGSERLAAEAATSAAPPFAEPSRTVIIAVDQNSLSRGSEKKMSAMIARVLDLIGPTDRAALIPLPLERTASVAVSTDRRSLWSTLGRIRVGSASAPLALARAEDPPPLPDQETREARNPSSDARPATEPDPQPGLARETETRQEMLEIRAPGALGDLRALLSAVRELPGTKMILVIRGTTAPESESGPELAGAARLESAGLPQVAAGARTTVQAVTLGDKGRGGADEVARLARLTGGDEFRLGKQADKEIERLGVWMTEGLRILIEGTPGDLDGRAHQIAISTKRRDVAVRAPERWLPFEAPAPTPIAVEHRTTTATPGAASGAVPSTAPLPPTDPELQRVLARMSSYVTQYVQEFSAVVAEETYEQRLTFQTLALSRPSTRKLRSDFLLVTIPGKEDWMPFRDVFEVDSKPIRDRDDRLRKLFIEMPPDALNKARQILDEGARYNLGSMYRNINLPVLTLVFLKPQYVGRLRFRRAGQEGIEGVHTWRIDFDETSRPTVIQNDKVGRDVPASGSLWVDPVTGRIVKTRIRMEDASLKMDTTVVYRRSDTLHMWAPAEMTEVYTSGVEQVTGEAKYKNFRRFRVDVEERIAVPKD